MIMRKWLLSAPFLAAFLCPAWAQVADQDHVWATPGNATVGGIVTLCQNASGKAVPCSSSGGTATNVVIQPTSAASAGITPIVGGSAISTLQLKNGAGNLYSVYANSSVSGYLMVFNTTTTPTNGATTAGTASGNMVECVGPSTQPFISNLPGPPDVYSTGIYAAFSTTGCATLTLSATAFIKGKVQ